MIRRSVFPWGDRHPFPECSGIFQSLATAAEPLAGAGYIVPQAPDLTVAGVARWGSRPMAEHRVMSEASLA